MNRILIAIRLWAIAVAAVGLSVAYAPTSWAGNNTPVGGAAFTTVNENVDGTGHCANGNPDVNCNIYDSKDVVWLTGGPTSSALSNGTYFFAVVAPGGQGGNANPNDCTDKNLSDLCSTTSTGAGDAWTNRVFSISGGVISYGGTHDFDSNKIRLMGYDDTTAPGGVYILAICSLADATDTGDPSNTGFPPGVDPSDCKYDAFKVKSGTSEEGGPQALTITKNATGSYDFTYAWDIAKSVDKTKVVQVGGSVIFNYTVTVHHDAGTVSNIKIVGTITVFNPNVDDSQQVIPVDIDGVTDTLSDGTVCTVTDGGPQTLTLAKTDFAYECDLTSLPSEPLDNTASVTWPDQTIASGFLVGDTDEFTFKGITLGENVVDECVSVSDTNSAGPQNVTVCVGDKDPDVNPATFTYQVTIPVPDNDCTTLDNTATFTTNDNGATGSASQEVKVCKSPLTIGYWKTHAANSNKNGPNYAPECSKLKNGNCSSNGPWEIQYLPQSLGTYSVGTILLADAVWGATTCSNASSSDNNAEGCLAGQLLAAKLNIANGACKPASIVSTIASADSFLINNTTPSYKGPGFSYALNTRATAVSLKTSLDNYNNGLSCF